MEQPGKQIEFPDACIGCPIVLRCYDDLIIQTENILTHQTGSQPASDLPDIGTVMDFVSTLLPTARAEADRRGVLSAISAGYTKREDLQKEIETVRMDIEELVKSGIIAATTLYKERLQFLTAHCDGVEKSRRYYLFGKVVTSCGSTAGPTVLARIDEAE